jgi:sugar O-acyltransferase (sialic acid O-acetyltransferase NeuD family)
MKKELIIFGTGDIAELAHYYFSNDTSYEVAAFVIDQKYISDPSFCSLPVIGTEDVVHKYSPDNYDIFIALSYSKLNLLRKKKYLAFKKKGYKFASYISSHATVLSSNIGENCFILEDNTIQPYVHIGDNVTLWSGNHIGHHSNIGSHVFISSHVVISGGVSIGQECFLGVNSTIRDHLSIGQKSIIGAGALVLKDLKDNSLVKGVAGSVSREASATIKNI